MARCAFQDLRDILLGLGYKMHRDAKGFVFEYARPASRLYLDHFEDTEIVDERTLVMVRFTLDQRNILSRADFEALLRERTLAG